MLPVIFLTIFVKRVLYYLLDTEIAMKFMNPTIYFLFLRLSEIIKATTTVNRDVLTTANTKSDKLMPSEGIKTHVHHYKQYFQKIGYYITMLQKVPKHAVKSLLIFMIILIVFTISKK